MSALLRLLVEFEVPVPGRQAAPEMPVAADLDAGFDAGLDPDLDAAFGMTPDGMPDLSGFGEEDLGTDEGLALLAPPDDPAAAAVAAALAEAEAVHAAVLAETAERHAAELAEARLRWVADEAAPLAESFRQALAGLEDSLADGLGAALEPLLGGALRQAAVRELRGAIADLVLAGMGGRIAVSGPADLLDALGEALRDAGIDTAGMDFAPADVAEVSVTADASAIETRLGAVTEALQRRLGT